MKQFTFKKNIPTGYYAHFETEYHDIKLEGDIVGCITECKSYGTKKRSDDGKFAIGLKVWKKDIYEDGNPNCAWKWIYLKYRANSGEEARDFIRKYNDKLQELFPIYTSNVKMKRTKIKSKRTKFKTKIKRTKH